MIVEVVCIFDGFREREKTDDVNTRRELMKAFISKSLIELIDHYKKNKASLKPTHDSL